MSDSKLCLSHLLVELEPVKAEWKMFGTFLKIQTLLLQNIDDLYLNKMHERDITSYNKEIETFERDNCITDFKHMVEDCQIQEPRGVVVVLKLGHFWNDRNVKNLNHLVRKLFGHNASLLKLVEIHHSVLTIVYKAPSWAVLPLIVSVARVKEEVAFAAIHSIQIGTLLLNLHSKDGPSKRLTMLSSIGDRPNEIQFLYDLGVNINEGAIVTALVFKRTHALKKLLMLGGDPDKPLLNANFFGFSHCVFLLLYHGANPNIRNPKNETPILLASSRGDYKIISLLLHWKATPKFHQWMV